MPAYRHVFAANDVAIQQLAYYFEYRHAHSDRLLELGSALMQFIATWRAAYESGSAGTFSIVPDASGRWRLLDTRFNRSRADLTLNREEVAIAVMADKPIGTERLLRSGPAQGMSCEVAGAVLEKLLSLGIIRRVGERLVTLPMLPDSVRVAFKQVPSSQDREVTWLARASSS